MMDTKELAVKVFMRYGVWEIPFSADNNIDIGQEVIQQLYNEGALQVYKNGYKLTEHGLRLASDADN